jgi:hypothetical protein
VASARSNLSLVIDATGTSPHAMLASATGSGTLQLSGLQVSGLNSAALPVILSDADAVTTEINDATVSPIVNATLFDGKMVFPKLDIPFSITGAKLRADKVQGENAEMQLDAEATLGLGDATLDASLDATFKPGEQAVAGADPIVRLMWQGPFVAPAVSVDVTQMTSFLSLRKFEQERRRVEILQARMAEQQRLRREASLYRARDTERQRLRQKALDDARLLQKAQDKRSELARQEEEKLRLEREKPNQIGNQGDLPAQ